MEQILDAKTSRVVQQETLKELQDELERIDSKIKSNEKLSVEDGKFISNLGWISAMSVTMASITIAGIAVSL